MRFFEFVPAVAAGARIAGTALARGAKAGTAAAGRVGQQMGQQVKTAGKTVAQQAVDKAMDRASDIAADKLLKVGQQVPIAGKILKIDDVQGDEVTISDPKDPKGAKTVLNKASDEVKNLVATLRGTTGTTGTTGTK